MQRKLMIALFQALALTSLQLWAMDIVLLPANDVPALMQQCSRPVPTTSTIGWLPKDQTVNVMVAKLPFSPVFRDSRLQDIGQYNFQAVGIFIGKKKAIYLNGVARSAWGKADSSKPVVACDGGNTYFGVVYDPSDKTFSHLSINGPR